MEGEAPRRGRPPKPAEERKSASLKMRTRADLRKMLEAAAAATGRSVSEEAEYRLLASFASEKPSLTAEDVRQIVREEMGQTAPVEVPERFDHSSWIIPADLIRRDF